MASRLRPVWLAGAVVAYVAFAALRASGNEGLSWLEAASLGAALVVGFKLTESTRLPEIDPVLLASTRTTITACLAAAAARTAPHSPGFSAIVNAGAAVASTSAMIAASRIPSPGGLLQPSFTPRRLDAAAFGALLWTVAIGLPAAQAFWPSRAAALEPVVLDFATVAASLGALGLGVFVMLRIRITRGLELGIAERTNAALLATLTSLAIAMTIIATGAATPEQVLPVTVLVAALAQTSASFVDDATILGKAMQKAFALTIVGAPLAAIEAWSIHRSPERTDVILGLTVLFALLCGLAAPSVARALSPAVDRWLTAFEQATRAALVPDPNIALEAALSALRRPLDRPGEHSDPSAATPTLYRLDPPEAVTVDRAGFAQTRRAELPSGLVAIIEAEPDYVLRHEALRAAVVRRPETRPMLAWFEGQALATAAAVRDDSDTIAVLAIPQDKAKRLMSLAEVNALGALAKRMGAVVGVSAMLARSQRREQELVATMDGLRKQASALASVATRDAARREELVRAVERKARVASYSPPARVAIQELERPNLAVRPITLLSAPGIDVAAWAAVPHLASSRRDQVFVVVDATEASEHTLDRWREAKSSPLALAAGGTLVLRDAHALPRDVQRYIVASMPPDVGLVVALPNTADALVVAGTLDESLADLLGDSAIAIPTLALRGEDLRPLALEHLAHIGMRLRGQPIGIALGAMAALLDHEWPGNDLEFEATLLRAALIAQGHVLERRDLEAIGFLPPSRDRNHR